MRERMPWRQIRLLIHQLCLLALLLVQVLGLLHRIAHIDEGQSTHHESALFADHDDSGRECRLFDALSTGAGPSGVHPPLLAGPAPAEALSFHPAPAIRSARPRHALARAPPGPDPV
jgi:hypothetical protein